MTLAVNIAQSGSNNVSFRNRLINSAMVIDQRNAGASVTPTGYTLDRWTVNQWSSSGKFSVQQNAGSVTPPAGFTHYLGATSLSAYSVASGDFYAILQPIEGLNVADLAWGTVNAKTVTLSFWVRSSLTGTFGGAIQNSATNRSYPYSYAISSANTWEYKTVTIAGDTSGTWLTTNGIGMYVAFSLGAGATYLGTAGAWAGSDLRAPTGQTSVVGTNGATFYITGVQLEAGSTASPFEYRQYGTELGLCQRYFQTNVLSSSDYPFSSVYAYTTSVSAGCLPIAVPMRATPTAAIVGNMALNGYGLGSQTLSSLGTIYSSIGIGSGITIFCNPTTTTASLTANQLYCLVNRGSNTGYTLSAEL